MESLLTLLIVSLCGLSGATASHNDSYSLVVSGPALSVIGSRVTFNAEVHRGKVIPSFNDTLVYDWTTLACVSFSHFKPCTNTTRSHDRATSVSQFSFNRYLVKDSGVYMMSVTAYKEVEGQKGQLLAMGALRFTLTDKLNGHLNLSQDVSLGRDYNIFLTHKDVSLGAVLTDTFTQLVSYNCTWVIHRVIGDTNTTYHTTDISLDTTVPQSGLYIIMVTVEAVFEVHNLTGNLTTVSRQNTFSDQAIFMDPVSHIDFRGNLTCSTGQNLTADIVCEGSGTFLLLVRILDPNRKPVFNGTFESECCVFTFSSGNLTSEGDYSIKYTVKNEVSSKENQVTVTVHKVETPVPSDLVPVFAVVIGILSFAIIIYIYVKEYGNKHSIEAANFSFRPPGGEHDTTYSLVRTRLKKWLRRVRGSMRSFYGQNTSSSSSSSREQSPDTSPDPSPSTSVSTGISRSSGGSYGAMGLQMTSHCQASGTTRSAQKPQWLEQSSENPGAERDSSVWLIQRPSTPWSDQQSDNLNPPPTEGEYGESPYFV